MQIHSRRINSTQGWRNIGDKRIYARSLWEANFAKYLEWQKSKGIILRWEHEPQTFWFEGIKRGCNSYKPDFLVWLPSREYEWFEVKGYYDSKTLTKIKRFRKFFPEEKLRLIDAKWFRSNNAKLSRVVPDWETHNSLQRL